MSKPEIRFKTLEELQKGRIQVDNYTLRDRRGKPVHNWANEPVIVNNYHVNVIGDYHKTDVIRRGIKRAKETGVYRSDNGFEGEILQIANYLIDRPISIERF